MFASLTYLKSQLLAEALRQDTSYDDALTAIGRGVVAQFEKACNRKFSRLAGDVQTFGADRCQFLLSRFPVEEVTKSELKLTEAEGWVEQASDYIRALDQAAGIIYLPDGADAGPYYAQVRFTFTGGFWFDTSEDGSDANGLPVGATALPDDLKLAWILQCKKIWEVNDPLGNKIVPSKEVVQLVGLSLAGLELIPEVKEILGHYLRPELT